MPPIQTPMMNEALRRVIKRLHYPLEVMLAIGIVVDDAIVVVENVEMRLRLESGREIASRHRPQFFAA